MRHNHQAIERIIGEFRRDNDHVGWWTRNDRDGKWLFYDMEEWEETRLKWIDVTKHIGFSIDCLTETTNIIDTSHERKIIGCLHSQYQLTRVSCPTNSPSILLMMERKDEHFTAPDSAHPATSAAAPSEGQSTN